MTITNEVPPIILVALGEASSLEGVLSRERCTLLEARSGALALEWARDIQPDDLRVAHNVPVLILSPHPPTPEELTLKLQAYVQAKRNIDIALADGRVDPTTGIGAPGGGGT